MLSHTGLVQFITGRLADALADDLGDNMADHAREGRGFAADLSIRTIAPPRTTAHGSAHCHSIHAKPINPCVATHTQVAPINANGTRTSVIVATISLPLATNATIHPTNIPKMRCVGNIPFSIHK
jgi:hypothetical protein